MTIQTTFRDIFGNVSKLCRPRELMTFEMVCMTPWFVALWLLNAFKIKNIKDWLKENKTTPVWLGFRCPVS